MLVHLLRRLGQSALVLLAVSFVSFMVFRHIGDPTISLLGEDATVAEREALTESLGFNKPVPLQYLGYVGKVLQGDLGISYRLKRPVTEIIAERLPATLELAMTAALFALVIGVALGVYTAIRREGWLSRSIMTVSLVGVSLPTFLIGIALIYLFVAGRRWVWCFGGGERVWMCGWESGRLSGSGWGALCLWAISLGFYTMSLIMRLVRAEMLGGRRADSMCFGGARG